MAPHFKELTPEEAQKFIGAKKVHVVDIRDPQSFEDGHLKGAVNVGDSNLQDFLASAERNQPLICYCYHGISSQMAAEYFVSQGFKEVCHITGGFEGWKSAFPGTAV